MKTGDSAGSLKVKGEQAAREKVWCFYSSMIYQLF
jgi:hypothetical protein